MQLLLVNCSMKKEKRIFENEIGERDWRTTDCQFKCNRLYLIICSIGTFKSILLHCIRCTTEKSVMISFFPFLFIFRDPT